MSLPMKVSLQLLKYSPLAGIHMVTNNIISLVLEQFNARADCHGEQGREYIMMMRAVVT